jgi:ABC-type transport system involved in multi-copper enzyme maturation permease subunit
MAGLTDSAKSSFGAQVSGALHMFSVSLRRLAASRQTIVSFALLGFTVLVALAWSLRRDRDAAEFTEDMLLPIYMSFLLPIFCLSYGTASISSDREEQTLVYLLLTPIARPIIHLAKFAAAICMSLLWTFGSMLVLCGVAGTAGWEAYDLFWPAIVFATFAYVGLFHLLSVMFRRATIIALAYALFLEAFIGNMPGIVKRMSILFYVRCMMFEEGAELDIGPSGRAADLFLPVSGSTACMALSVLTAAFFIAGTWFFSRREYL